MPHHHDVIFTVLSLVVAVFGSWTALDLFRRVRTHVGQTRRLWLAAAAVAMGLSIWSMHFIAMLGFDPGSPVSYDPTLTALSLAIAVGATLGAFLAAAQESATPLRIVAAGAAMGTGICLMHYVGMAAVRTAVSLGNKPVFIALSFAVAFAASTAALFGARRDHAFGRRAAAAVLLGLAVVGMHYTAMAGLQITRAGGVAPPPGAPPLVLGVSVAAGSLAILFMALLASLYDERLNVLGALEAGGVGYWELSLPDYTLHVSPRGKEIMGRPTDRPLTHAEWVGSLAPEDQARRVETLAAVIRDGSDYDAEYRVVLETGEERWINIRGQVVGRPSGKAMRLVGVVLDVTDRRRAFAAVSEAQQRQTVLIDELNHRVKNTLATVQSLARQTAKRSATMQEFQSVFEARLLALSQTHNALTRGGWEVAWLHELLAQEFSPYSDEQVQLSGPEVRLKPRQALSLGMIFHELATNAAKYGGLSTPAGRVRVEWSIEGDHLLILWTESGGPAVRKPSGTGFGSRLIKEMLSAELAGRGELDFAADGLKARLDIPL